MDVLTPQQRSHCMRNISSKNTKPEMLVRKALFALGLRYRIHRKDLPGTPDLVFPRLRAVILIHGCFWHGHGCNLFVIPQTNRDFWMRKIEGNRARDRKSVQQLRNLGWRVLIVWECVIRGGHKQPVEVLINRIHKWLVGGRAKSTIPQRRH
jgi:DNA mismatch endonuclease, patch repair protein